MALKTKTFYSVYWNGQLQTRYDNLAGARAGRQALIRDLMRGRVPGDRQRTEREVEIRQEIFSVEEVNTPMGKRYRSPNNWGM